MSVPSSKIASATVVFCVFQVLLVALGCAGYAMLAYRVNHFDYGKLRIDEDKILTAVQLATKEFLYNYQTNMESNVEQHVPNIEVKECNGVVYGTLRNHFARIGCVDYGVGDLIKDGTNLYQVALIDFERQRLYGLADNGDKLILCMVGLSSKGDDKRLPERRPASTRSSEGERDDERLRVFPFS